MSSELIGIIGIVIMVGLVLMGIPVAVSLLLTGFVGLYMITGFDASAIVLATKPYVSTANFVFLCLPLFILMGEFALQGGIGEDTFKTASNWLGRLSGGLAIATTAGCAIFGAVSGSSIAANSIFCKIALPEMTKRNYDVRLATGSIACAGTLAILIPPSNALVLYGMLTQTSIGKILVAGYLPGVLSALVYSLGIFIMVKTRPRLAPLSPQGVSWKVRLKSINRLWAVAMIVIMMLGGIYTGIFTPSEGAAFGCAGTFIIALAKGRLSIQRIKTSLMETMRITGMLFLILVGAMVFTTFLALCNITAPLVTLVSEMSPRAVIICFLIVFGIMGMFIDTISMMVLGLPVFFPVVQSMGIDPTWFGILVMITCELGGISPPYAINVFVIKAIVGDQVSLGDIYRGVTPFIFMMVVVIVIIFLFPSIATWLPNTMLSR